jgi:hypothetical protein
MPLPALYAREECSGLICFLCVLALLLLSAINTGDDTCPVQMLAKASTLVFEAGAPQGEASTAVSQEAASVPQTVRVPALSEAPDSEHTILKELVARYSIPEDAR